MDVLAAQIGGLLKSHGLMLATAESCTGGGIAYAVTEVAGSSAWFERGFVTYSNLSKQQMLGVAEETLQHHGAVSEAVVREMVAGALRHSGAQVALCASNPLSTQDDVAAALGVLFNIYDVAGGDSTVATASTVLNVTTGGDVNHAASGSFTLNGDTITFKDLSNAYDRIQYGDKSNIIEYYSQNVECYLMKPVSKKELINQVETLLNPQRR